MFLKLYLAPPPSADAAANKVYFRGEGVDDVGSFTLEGASETETGVVIAVKRYNRYGLVGVAWRDNTIWDGRGVGSRVESPRMVVDMATGVVRKESSSSCDRGTVDRRHSRATRYNPDAFPISSRHRGSR
jgi:hypothetical protein